MMANIRTRSQRAKRFKFLAAEKGPFETLPVDVFHLLFPYLEPHDRLALSITCKTLHAADRYIGEWKVQEFYEIEAESSRVYDENSIRTIPSMITYRDDCIPITYRDKKSKIIIFRNAGMFQHASTSLLNLIIEGQMNYAVSFMFAFTQFKQLKARVRDQCFFPRDLLEPQQSDSATRFLATLLKRQWQNEIEVDIEWKFCNHSFSVFRESIKGLKSLRKIRLDWQDQQQEDYRKRDYPISNDSLRNLVRITRECSVGLANISARCILDVFEICFNSTDREKKIELLTEKSIISNLRRLVRVYSHLGYYWEHNHRDSRLRKGDGQNCTYAIIEEPPFSPGGTRFNQSRGEGYHYRRVTISRVPPLSFAHRTAY